MLGDVAGLSESVLALGRELGQRRGVDAANDGDERDDGEGDERQLPHRGESDDESGDKGPHVVNEIPELSKKKIQESYTLSTT